MDFDITRGLPLSSSILSLIIPYVSRISSWPSSLTVVKSPGAVKMSERLRGSVTLTETLAFPRKTEPSSVRREFSGSSRSAKLSRLPPNGKYNGSDALKMRGFGFSLSVTLYIAFCPSFRKKILSSSWNFLKIWSLKVTIALFVSRGTEIENIPSASVLSTCLSLKNKSTNFAALPSWPKVTPCIIVCSSIHWSQPQLFILERVNDMKAPHLTRTLSKERGPQHCRGSEQEELKASFLFTHATRSHSPTSKIVMFVPLKTQPGGSVWFLEIGAEGHESSDLAENEKKKSLYIMKMTW